MDVDPGSPADGGSLAQYDVILKVNGVTVTSAADASRLLQKIPAGGRAALLVWKTRQGEQQWLTIKKEVAQGMAVPCPRHAIPSLLLLVLRQLPRPSHGRPDDRRRVRRDGALPRDARLLRAGCASDRGATGDFFTSVDLGPLFGELLASQFAEMWRRCRRRGIGPTRTGPTPVRPRGSRRGQWPAGARRAGRSRAAPSPFYRAVRLHLVERSPQARAAQETVLGRHASVLASSSADVPRAVAGVIYANELLDALPPHVVVMRERGLREVYVDADGGRLVTREGPPSSPRLAEYLGSVGARLEPGWFAEVNLAAADWIRRAGRCLERGFLVIIDYGHDAAHALLRLSRDRHADHLSATRRRAARRRARLAAGTRRARHHVPRGPHRHRAWPRATRACGTAWRRRPGATSCSGSASPSGWPTTTAGRPARSRDAWR